MVTVEEAVADLLSGDLTQPVEGERLHAVAAGCGVAPAEFYNALLVETARRFLLGDLSCDDADAVANDVWVSITSDMVDMGDAFEMPEPAYSIYEAFDAGEYPHGDGLDPVETYTRPDLRRILAARPSRVAEAAAQVVQAITARADGTKTPFVVAVDGPSGSGKSTIAALAGAELGATAVWPDDFFDGRLSDDDWEARSPAERARDCIDWRRVRDEALEPLLLGRPAEWHAFDWDAGPRDDGSYGYEAHLTVVQPAPVILIDGAYSGRPELADLVDLSILVRAPQSARRERLALRDGPEHFHEWFARWGVAEAHYFEMVRPPDSFDVVVEN